MALTLDTQRQTCSLCSMRQRTSLFLMELTVPCSIQTFMDFQTFIHKTYFMYVQSHFYLKKNDRFSRGIMMSPRSLTYVSLRLRVQNAGPAEPCVGKY